jgi:hypothetical protein
VVKGVAGSYPRWLYYDQGYDSSGLATISLYPQPQANLTLYIDSAKQLQSFAAVSTALLMPPGYQRAIESNFTIETSPGFKSVLAGGNQDRARIEGRNRGREHAGCRGPS